MSNKKKVSENEQIRQLFELPEVKKLREEVEARARKNARMPREVSLKSLSTLQKLLIWQRVVEIAAVAAVKTEFLRESSTTIKPVTLMKRLQRGAVRVWGFC
ncbi:hypothetical protein FM104_14390 [Microbacterium esteraromaticum]|uniref:Uncharacterized protein n=1 Tax=Microbacterium esteraromaticum TaxID=57043 RepID=A0A1R4KNM0_9MICO|nr:hypothetical protein [Microbacterium esteraromaticum]SJN45941.1 hypothetical protein FM104_14390 [Microbacterium esteraromaticum]